MGEVGYQGQAAVDEVDGEQSIEVGAARQSYQVIINREQEIKEERRALEQYEAAVIELGTACLVTYKIWPRSGNLQHMKPQPFKATECGKASA